MHKPRFVFCLLLAFVICQFAGASDWPEWRGPNNDGVSNETGLISSWSEDGDNFLWKNDFIGRSTPVVVGGRVCANGRVGDGIDRQEMVACFDVESGKKLWEYRFNVYLTTVPWNRVGWPNIAADPETGNIYVQGVGGTFLCLDKNGKVVWSRSLNEEYGFFSGYGGRTQSPTVDEGRVIVTFVSGSWGAWAAPRHRTFAFDKKTGELLWVSSPGEMPPDLNTQGTPAVATIRGQRLLIQGNADGSVCAIQARTGKPVWRFQLSKRGLNTSVLVDGETVFATHSEENVSGGPMGAVVAIDGSGQGDVTETHELWRTPLQVGFASPLLKDGKLYVVDNSANLYCLDASTGKKLWEFSIGTVGKGSPVWADGKIFVTEVNGRLQILEPGEQGARSLHEAHLTVPGGRYAEIYGSPAIAYGRIFFTTEAGFYAIGDSSRPVPHESYTPPPIPAGKGDVAAILAIPAEIELRPGAKKAFRVLAFDNLGRPLGERSAEWSLEGLSGRLSQKGELETGEEMVPQVGQVRARVGDLTAESRVRVFPQSPRLVEDFESVAAGKTPQYFLSSLIHFKVEVDPSGNHYLVKNPSPKGIHRHETYIGSHDWSHYTIEADFKGTRQRRAVPDMGLVNSGYTMEIMGVHQQIQISSWAAARRMAQEVPFAWEFDRWYHAKLRVDATPRKAVIRGKVWPREDPEPQEWTIVVEDPHPIERGAPALFGNSPAPIYIDNVRVTPTAPTTVMD